MAKLAERIMPTPEMTPTRTAVDPKLTARFPKKLTARGTVRTKYGRVLVKEHLGYHGGIDNPLTCTQPVSHLMGLLAQVGPMPVYARTHRGIQ
jgi:hypothetical protein